MEGDRHRVEITAGLRLVLEVAVTILAPNQRSRIPVRQGLPGIRRDIADGIADAPIVALVGMRSMGNAKGEQGRVAGGHLEIHRLALVYAFDGLPAGEHVVLVIGLDVGQIGAHVTARQHPHAAAFLGGVRERHPHRYQPGGIQAPVLRVLVPGNEGGRVRFLDPPVGGPDHDVRADEILDHVEDPGRSDQIRKALEQQVAFKSIGASERTVQGGLEGLEPSAERERFVRRKDRLRREKTVAAELLDFSGGEGLGHEPKS